MALYVYTSVGWLLVPAVEPLRKTEHQEFTQVFEGLADSLRYKMAMSDDIDWDEVTDPGVGPITAPLFSIPTISTDGIAKTDRCYLCFGKQNVLEYRRSPSDSILVCVWCMYDHLGWELGPDGKLIRVSPGT